MACSCMFLLRRFLCLSLVRAVSVRPSSADGDTDGDMESFALVPRPMRLEPLDLSAGFRLDADTGNSARSLTFSLSPGPHSLNDPRVKATLRAFESFLGTTSGLDNAKGVNSDAIVSVSLKATVAEAEEACTSAAFFKSGSKPRMQPLPVLSDEESLEWHMAINLGGHLRVCARDPEGAFRFLQTLRQMLSTTAKPRVEADSQGLAVPGRALSVAGLPNFILQDWPQHTWRGLQLDAVRHFMPIPFLKRYLMAMALVKANVFHWHVADDQAWRIYSPSRPKLVLASARTSPEYYTIEEVRDVVDFATSLFIHVMPVFEMPGHVLAALSAYPDISCTPEKHFEVPKSREGIYKEMMCVGKETTASFARDVLTDAVALFPFPYIHVGGDEIESKIWETSADVRAFADRVGLKNLASDVTEAWFCLVGNTLKRLNKTPVMWDDHFKQRSRTVTRKCPGAEEDWIVQSWLTEGDVGNGYSVSSSFPFRSIASPLKSVYLDYPVASIHFNTTVEWKLGRGKVLGGAAQMWTEDSPPDAVPSKVYPRFFGIADRLWGYSEPTSPRKLDMEVYTAAKRQCTKGAPLAEEAGFDCGKFELHTGGRIPIWADANILSNLAPFAENFNADRAFDADEESYFWCISPNAESFFQVRWSLKKYPTGRWLKNVTIPTGSVDRPNDVLESGILLGAQWMLPKNAEKRELTWVEFARFEKGRAAVPPDLFDYGPVSALHIIVLKRQEKWVAIPEINVDLEDEREHLLQQDALPPGDSFWDRPGPPKSWSQKFYHRVAEKPRCASLRGHCNELAWDAPAAIAIKEHL
eukprot:TRINITY_DN9089_c0_g2_i1.p1 TRINITY_DN9089_c0_g2~~TRINITY_DN9089_c0_g2_i1.p1  ORF type:complete len:811 (-),score=121.57 TRINITY_DN9089_c0_g2_i1:101-2533(-)